jgi:hypothetical protein
LNPGAGQRLPVSVADTVAVTNPQQPQNTPSSFDDRNRVNHQYHAGSYGLVYQIDTSGAETVLYNFTGGADVGDPVTPVILDDAGHLYGTASGDFSRIYAGVAFKITLP